MTAIQIQGVTAEQLFQRLDQLESLIQNRQPQQLVEQVEPREQYLTREQVAEILQVSRQTLSIWNKKGVLKSYRIGTRVRYKLTDVQQVLETRTK